MAKLCGAQGCIIPTSGFRALDNRKDSREMTWYLMEALNYEVVPVHIESFDIPGLPRLASGDPLWRTIQIRILLNEHWQVWWDTHLGWLRESPQSWTVLSMFRNVDISAFKAHSGFEYTLATNSSIAYTLACPWKELHRGSYGEDRCSVRSQLQTSALPEVQSGSSSERFSRRGLEAVSGAEPLIINNNQFQSGSNATDIPGCEALKQWWKHWQIHRWTHLSCSRSHWKVRRICYFT